VIYPDWQIAMVFYSAFVLHLSKKWRFDGQKTSKKAQKSDKNVAQTSPKLMRLLTNDHEQMIT